MLELAQPGPSAQTPARFESRLRSGAQITGLVGPACESTLSHAAPMLTYIHTVCRIRTMSHAASRWPVPSKFMISLAGFAVIGWVLREREREWAFGRGFAAAAL